MSRSLHIFKSDKEKAKRDIIKDRNKTPKIDEEEIKLNTELEDKPQEEKKSKTKPKEKKFMRTEIPKVSPEELFIPAEPVQKPAHITEDSCPHTSIIHSEGKRICSLCNDVLDFTTSGCTDIVFEIKKTPKTIIRDLDNFSFSQAIKEKANQIYIEKFANKTHRATTRLSVVFICLYEAFKASGIPKDPNEIRKKMGITHEQMSKGVRLNSPIFTGKKTKRIYVTAVDFVSDIFSKFNVEVTDEIMEEIKQIYERTVKKSSVIITSKPQSVAAGLVYYYMNKEGMEMTKSKFSSVVSPCQMTISKIYKEFEKYESTD